VQAASGGSSQSTAESWKFGTEETRVSLGMRCERGYSRVFGQECASCGGGRSCVISEKRKSAEGIENKGRSVVTGMGKNRIAGCVCERESRVHAEVTYSRYCL
jgi:hypothetical protein